MELLVSDRIHHMRHNPRLLYCDLRGRRARNTKTLSADQFGSTGPRAVFGFRAIRDPNQNRKAGCEQRTCRLSVNWRVLLHTFQAYVQVHNGDDAVIPTLKTNKIFKG